MLKLSQVCAPLLPQIESPEQREVFRMLRFFSRRWSRISVLHREWCNFFFLKDGIENRPVFRATIEPV
jgi:hypothetical protein